MDQHDLFPVEWDFKISNPMVRESIYKAFGGKCFYTGREVAFEDMQIDHIWPRAKEGPDNLFNYVCSDADFNNRKNDKFDEAIFQRFYDAVAIAYRPSVLRRFKALVKKKEEAQKKSIPKKTKFEINENARKKRAFDKNERIKKQQSFLPRNVIKTIFPVVASEDYYMHYNCGGFNRKMFDYSGFINQSSSLNPKFNHFTQYNFIMSRKDEIVMINFTVLGWADDIYDLHKDDNIKNTLGNYRINESHTTLNEFFLEYNHQVDLNSQTKRLFFLGIIDCKILVYKGSITKENETIYDITNLNNIPDGLDIHDILQNYKFEYNGSLYHDSKADDYHHTKSRLCKNRGIDLIHIFEADWMENKSVILDDLKSKILSRCNPDDPVRLEKFFE